MAGMERARRSLKRVPSWAWIAGSALFVWACSGDSPTSPNQAQSQGVAGQGSVSALHSPNTPPTLAMRTEPAFTPGSPHPVIRGQAPLFNSLNLCSSSDPDTTTPAPDGHVDSLRYDVRWGDGTTTGPGAPGAGTTLEDGGGKTGCDGKDCCRHRHEFEKNGEFVIEASVSDKHLEDQGRNVAAQARATGRIRVLLGAPEDLPPSSTPTPSPTPTSQCGGGKCVFVTSSDYAPDFGGAANADGICQTHASGAGLSGTYRAWVSGGGSSPSTRFTQAGVPYVLPDGTVVASNWSQLTSGNLTNPINRNEFNSASGNRTWTGTLADGTESGVDCAGWTTTDVDSVGTSGSVGSTDTYWTAGPGYSHCGLAHKLYCFQQ
jgi:hypothetical protein